VMEGLIKTGTTGVISLWYAMIIVATSTIALGFLFFLGKKDRFYPAMPFITTGCLIGYGIIFLLV